MPTAAYPLGAGTHFTSGANGGAGFGTAAYTTTNAAYNPTANRLLVVIVGGLTNNAGTLTGPSFTTSVGTGSNPTWTQHTAGWLSATATGWCPFVTIYYTTIGGTAPTNLRFILDATDDIYQWFVLPIEYDAYNSSTPLGRWGSDTANADTADNESTQLDQNTGTPLGASSHVLAIMSADGTAGAAVTPGTGWVERMESAAGGGATVFQVQDDQTSVDDTAEWGAVGTTIFSWITLAVEVNHSAATDATPTPAVVTIPITCPAPTISISRTAVLDVVTVPITEPAPTVVVGVTPTPAVVTVAITEPAPTITVSSTASPAVVTVPITEPAPTVSGNANPAPAVVTVPITEPAPTIVVSPTPTPAVVTVPITCPAPTITVSPTPAPEAVVVPITCPQPGVSVGGNATPTPAVVTVPITAPAPVISIPATVTPSVVPVTIDVPAPTLVTTTVAAPSVVTVQLALPAPVITTTAAITAAVVTVAVLIGSVFVDTGAPVGVEGVRRTYRVDYRRTYTVELRATYRTDQRRTYKKR